MSEPETNIHVLDAAYRPFPTFEEWASRTSVDTVRWDRYKSALESRPAQSGEALKRAFEVVKRAAALDTGAIEGLYEVDRGFTFSVAFETAAWEVELAKKGENVRPLFEAQLHAYDYVLDLATKSVPISEAAIRTLHEVVCQAQDTYRVQTPPFGFQEQKLPKGVYKFQSNHVYTKDGSFHSYAPADVTPIEMARLVNELRSDKFLAAHPVLQAAYAHYGLVVIHPFADGNGRVARALASVFTYCAISMPIMILSDQKTPYLDALERADAGDYQEFVNFFLQRSLDTMNVVDESFRGAIVPDRSESLSAVDRLYYTKGGFTESQVDDAGVLLVSIFDKELRKALAGIDSPNVRGEVGVSAGVMPPATPTHRGPLGNKGRKIAVILHSAAPVAASVKREFALLVPRDAQGEDDILLLSTSSDDTFSTRVDQAREGQTGLLEIRAAIFAKRIVDELLAQLVQAAEAERQKWK
jgi:Fic family protein